MTHTLRSQRDGLNLTCDDCGFDVMLYDAGMICTGCGHFTGAEPHQSILRGLADRRAER